VVDGSTASACAAVMGSSRDIEALHVGFARNSEPFRTRLPRLQRFLQGFLGAQLAQVEADTHGPTPRPGTRAAADRAHNPRGLAERYLVPAALLWAQGRWAAIPSVIDAALGCLTVPTMRQAGWPARSAAFGAPGGERPIGAANWRPCWTRCRPNLMPHMKRLPRPAPAGGQTLGCASNANRRVASADS
jgi:hypothetical protein